MPERIGPTTPESVVEAVYENGQLKFKDSFALAERTPVRVVVTPIDEDEDPLEGVIGIGDSGPQEDPQGHGQNTKEHGRRSTQAENPALHVNRQRFAQPFPHHLVVHRNPFFNPADHTPHSCSSLSEFMSTKTWPSRSFTGSFSSGRGGGPDMTLPLKS